jgi:hypothetical protein
MRKEHECVTLARHVRLCSNESLHELGSIWDEVFIFAVDSVHGEYGVLADVGMTVLETAAAGRNQGFEEFSIFGYRKVAPRIYSLGCCCRDMKNRTSGVQESVLPSRFGWHCWAR